MPFYEVIYENGQHSVMDCENDEEAAEGLREQHRRAKSGETGGPDGRNANRVARVYKYERHPNEWNPEQELSDKDATAATKGLTSAPAMVMALQGAVHPMVESGPHESNFKMQESEELDPALWGGE